MLRFLSEKSLIHVKRGCSNKFSYLGFVSDHPQRQNQSQARGVHTTSSLLRRHSTDRGIRRTAKIFEDDPEFINELESEEDFADLESDFMGVPHQVEGAHQDRRQLRRYNEKKMAIKQYFKPPIAPSMLTWAERLQIRQLHKEEPLEWTVDALADSFPATREIISKILKSEFVPDNLEKMRRLDKTVEQNWELLRKGALKDIDPEYLTHLKKFLPRREEHLKAITPSDFENLIKKDEPPKEIFNKGRMARILSSYERALESIDRKAANLLEVKNQSTEPKTDRQVIEDRVKFEQEFHPTDDDTLVIGGEIQDQQMRTLEEFKRKLIKYADPDNPMDKLLLEGAKTPEVGLDAILSNHDDSQGEEEKPKPKRKPINERLANLAGYSLPSKDEDKVLETPVKETPDEKDENKKDKSATSLQSVSPWNLKMSPVQSKVEEPEIEKTPLVCSTEREKEDFVKEEESIEGTFFWPSDEPEKHAKANSQLPEKTGDTEESPKIKMPRNKAEALVAFKPYANKIKIPKDKWKKGALFQLNDCFYDDSGYFMYRVPGLVKTTSIVQQQ